MGLDTSHDCWHGAYSAFTRWRVQLGRSAGLPVEKVSMYPGGEPILDWLNTDGLPDGDPLKMLLNHSDCDGEISAAECGPLADRLEGLLPLLPDEDTGGHIGNWRAKTKTFIDGLRLASAARENVEFH